MRSKLLLVAATIATAAAGGNAMATPVGAAAEGSGDGGLQVWIGGLLATPDATAQWATSQTNPDLYVLAGPVTWTTADGNTFTIGSASFDTDPVLVFSASATNNTGNALTYAFAFNSPLTPALTGAVTSHAELGVTLTDDGSGYAAVHATPGNSNMLRSFDLYSDGTGISKNVDIGPAFEIFAGTSGTNFSADSSLVCVQQCVTMSALLSFTLTAHDAAGFSGKIVQTSAVPLPGALGLLGSGLAGLVGFSRRRRRPLRAGNPAA